MGAEAAWLNVNEGLRGSEPWWTRINEAYGSEGRHYHDLAYLESKLALLQELGGASDLRALTFALFFQYLEYNPREGDSADKNVAHFKTFAQEVGMDAGLAGKVESLLATEGSGEDRGLLQDLDMAALGTPPEQYTKLSQQVREEYGFLSDQAYHTLRRKILQSFLLIPSLFSTDSFRERFESQARTNIEKEVASMGRSS